MSKGLKWEKIWEAGFFGGEDVHRSKIIGGWLVKYEVSAGYGGGGGVCFIPDPDHAWDGRSLNE